MSDLNINTVTIKYAIGNSNVSIHQKGDAMRDLSRLENEIEILNTKLKQANELIESDSSLSIDSIVGSALLEEVLREQKEIICSPRRDSVITAESIKKVFAKYGIVWESPF